MLHRVQYLGYNGRWLLLKFIPSNFFLISPCALEVPRPNLVGNRACKRCGSYWDCLASYRHGPANLRRKATSIGELLKGFRGPLAYY